MKKLLKKSMAMVLAATITFPTMGFATSLRPQNPTVDLNFFIDVLNMVEKRYPFELDKEKLMEGAINGMLSNVDDYSAYYNMEEAQELFNVIEGEFGGIGVEISLNKEGQVEIKRVIEGLAGHKAGLKLGDIITAVDGVELKGEAAEKAAYSLRGKEGTTVKISILREGKPVEFNVMREKIELKKTSSKVIDENIGYVQLLEFNSKGTKEVESILKSFDDKGISKIVLDLRNNPGGTLIDGVKIAEKFVEKGPIVHIRENGRTLQTYNSENEKSKYEVVVLVNENSASASEIVAGAIKDRKAGVLVGNTTFGKGTVQSVMPLTNGGVIKLTIAEYLTPNKTSINKKGIEPDYKVFNYNGEDQQLKKAVEILKSK